jgi:hypothetical protein
MKPDATDVLVGRTVGCVVGAGDLGGGAVGGPESVEPSAINVAVGDSGVTPAVEPANVAALGSADESVAGRSAAGASVQPTRAARIATVPKMVDRLTCCSAENVLGEPVGNMGTDQGSTDQFQVCHTVALPSVAGKFHSFDSQTRPPDAGLGSGIAPE